MSFLSIALGVASHIDDIEQLEEALTTAFTDVSSGQGGTDKIAKELADLETILAIGTKVAHDLGLSIPSTPAAALATVQTPPPAAA